MSKHDASSTAWSGVQGRNNQSTKGAPGRHWVQQSVVQAQTCHAGVGQCSTYLIRHRQLAQEGATVATNSAATSSASIKSSSLRGRLQVHLEGLPRKNEETNIGG